MLKFLVLIVSFLFLLFFLSCSGPDAGKPDPGSTEKNPVDSSVSTKKSSPLFVWKEDGIKFINNNRSSTIIPFNEKVFLLNETEKEYKIVWKTDTGNTDETEYLLPVPAYTSIYDGNDTIKAYVEKLKAAGFASNFKMIINENEMGYSKYAFEIPVTDIYKSFIVIKRIYGIPEPYGFPEAAEVTLATPEKPNPANKNRVAGYITQTFQLKYDSLGKPFQLTWYDDDEVGYLTVMMTVSEDKTLFEFEGGGH